MLAPDPMPNSTIHRTGAVSGATTTPIRPAAVNAVVPRTRSVWVLRAPARKVTAKDTGTPTRFMIPSRNPARAEDKPSATNSVGSQATDV